MNVLSRGSHAVEMLDESCPTFRTWVSRDWLPNVAHRLKASTFESYQGIVRLHLTPALGDLRLDEIQPRGLSSLYQRLLEGSPPAVRRLAPKTVGNVHRVLRSSLADAVRDGWILHNPALSARIPGERVTRTPEMRGWTAPELGLFLRQSRGTDLGLLWRVAALTGLRRGELLGLRWWDIDFAAHRIAVRRSLIAVRYEVIETTPKSHLGRNVDIDTDTSGRLAALREDHFGAGCDCQGGRVFVRKDASDLHPDLVSQAFRAEIRRQHARPIRFHDLRHTHATLALAAGVPVNVVAERLGHANPDFTLRQYASVIPGMQADAAAKVADLVDRYV